MMKLFIFFNLAIILLSGYAQIYNNEEAVKHIYPHYNIELSIDPQTQQIKVNGSLELDLSHVTADTLTFYLDRAMQITSFKIDGIGDAVIDTSQSDNVFMPKARKIFMDISSFSQKEKISTITFSYSGQVSELPEMYANRIGAQWTEMGLYYPWFPFSFDQLRLFTFDLSVEAPAQYEVFGIGTLEKTNGFTRISSSMPISDIVVCLSEEVKTHTSEIGENRIQIFYQSFDQTMVQDIAVSITMMMEQYNVWFGNKNSDISLIESPRRMGGGYARTGGVVLSDLDKEKYYSNIIKYEKYFAHEFGHLWWYKAGVSTWEDWINESFAEYSALMFIRTKHGQEVFDNIIKRMKETIVDTPPIWDFDRMGEDFRLVQKVLYNKGPVLLYELEQIIGQKAFAEFCNELIVNDIITTSGLLKLLETTQGKDLAEGFETMLKTR